MLISVDKNNSRPITNSTCFYSAETKNLLCLFSFKFLVIIVMCFATCQNRIQNVLQIVYCIYTISQVESLVACYKGTNIMNSIRMRNLCHVHYFPFTMQSYCLCNKFLIPNKQKVGKD